MTRPTHYPVTVHARHLRYRYCWSLTHSGFMKVLHALGDASGKVVGGSQRPTGSACVLNMCYRIRGRERLSGVGHGTRHARGTCSGDNDWVRFGDGQRRGRGRRDCVGSVHCCCGERKGYRRWWLGRWRRAGGCSQWFKVGSRRPRGLTLGECSRI